MATNRRRFLQLSGVVGIGAIAGCSGGSQDNSTPSGSTGDSTPTDAPTATPTETQEATTSEETRATSGGQSGEAAIEFGEASLVPGDDGSDEPPYAEFTAENTGTAASRSIFVELRWNSEDGGSSSNFAACYTLGVDEQWTARRAKPRNRTGFTDVEIIDTRVQTGPPMPPAGMELTQTSIEYRQGSSTGFITGTAENTGGESVDAVAARGKIYNSDSNVVGSLLTPNANTNGVAPDGTWNFELAPGPGGWTIIRPDEVSGSEVILDNKV